MTLRDRGTGRGPVGRLGVGGLLCLVLAACGGGGGSGTGDPAPASAQSAGPTDAQRAAAATSTAQSSSNACAAIQPFYWELGNRDGALASGSVGGTAYGATTSMQIASASKWLYGAYVMERRAGVLTADDIKALNFRSGYTSFSLCLAGQTVDGCVNYLNNGVYTAADEGVFAYGGGHMQKHASAQMGLGALRNPGLAAEMQSRLGSDIGLSYSQPQLAGGGVSTAADYARFLRKLLDGRLRLGAALGTQPVCTNPLTCASARNTPIPGDESWHYSLGHWVEDDPVVGDGAFSSPGAFGFYPWIDAGKTLYGVLARQDGVRAGVDSVYCGRLIRRAWVTATVQ